MITREKIMNKRPLITLDKVNKTFAERPILQNISMQLMQGEITTLIGPNGAGKSTLVRLILGLIQVRTAVQLPLQLI